MWLKLKDLSPTQRKVIVSMYENRYYLVCNEGANFKCWLADAQLKKVEGVNRNTGNALHRDQWVTLVTTEDKNQRNYYMNLTKSALRELDKQFKGKI